DLDRLKFSVAESVLAEREGFEPSRPRKGPNGFRDRPDRPLWHLSARGRAIKRREAKTPRAGRRKGADINAGVAAPQPAARSRQRNQRSPGRRSTTARRGASGAAPLSASMP